MTTVFDEWVQVTKDLKKASERESELRQVLFDHYFTNPKEGVNNCDIGSGILLQGTHRIDRKLDIKLLTLMCRPSEDPTVEDKRSDAEKVGLNPNEIVKWEGKLNIINYRNLNPEQTRCVDLCLTIRPRKPALEFTVKEN